MQQRYTYWSNVLIIVHVVRLQLLGFLLAVPLLERSRGGGLRSARGIFPGVLLCMQFRPCFLSGRHPGTLSTSRS